MFKRYGLVYAMLFFVMVMGQSFEINTKHGKLSILEEVAFCITFVIWWLLQTIG